MPPKLKITQATINQALEAQAVRDGITARARLILPRAQRAAAKAGRGELAKRLRLAQGTRPGTKSESGLRRPYARVEANYPAEAQAADAGATVTTRRILRGVARG